MDEEITLPPSDFVVNESKASGPTRPNRAFFKRHTRGRGRGGSHATRGKSQHRGGHPSRGRGNHHSYVCFITVQSSHPFRPNHGLFDNGQGVS